jgi:hypothetical protein
MVNYTDRLTRLMCDIVARVPALSFINMAEVLVFARYGRIGSEGAFATCHCLNLPTTEPGYFFWRDRASGQMTRRSEWFVTKSPVVMVDGQVKKYLISFTLPRFCDQSLSRSRKEKFYRRTTDDWIAKLDTVIHELYHIDPGSNGIRRIDRVDGTCEASYHGGDFFARVAVMVQQYLDSAPSPEIYEFLRHDFATFESRDGGIVGRAFRPFPSYPQRFMERLEIQPACDPAVAGVPIDPWRHRVSRVLYTDDDVHLRHFMRDTSRAVSQRPRRTRLPRHAGSRQNVSVSVGLQHSADAHETFGPVGRGQMLDAHDAAGTGRVDERVGTKDDADV